MHQVMSWKDEEKKKLREKLGLESGPSGAASLLRGSGASGSSGASGPEGDASGPEDEREDEAA